MPAWGAFTLWFLFTATAGMIRGLSTALGEEIGWRGNDRLEQLYIRLAAVEVRKFMDRGCATRQPQPVRQTVFDNMMRDTGKTLWYTTEFGVALAVVNVAFAVYFWTRRGAVEQEEARPSLAAAFN
jgi:hypothetical protein